MPLMERRINRSQQGDIGEASGVQVKTSTQRLATPGGETRSMVALATSGGNRRWNGTRKDRSRAFRLSLRADERWSQVVHTVHNARGAKLDHARRAEVFGVRDRRRGADCGSRVCVRRLYRIASGSGGVSKRSTDGDCKSSGSAFAGSNPASPIPAQTGILPQAACIEAGLQEDERLLVRSNGDGRIVLERVEPPAAALASVA